MNYPDFYTTFGEHLDPAIKYALYLCSYKSEAVLRDLDINIFNTKVVPEISRMIMQFAKGTRKVDDQLTALAKDKYNGEDYTGESFSIPYGDILGLKLFIKNITSGTDQMEKEVISHPLDSIDRVNTQVNPKFEEITKLLKFLFFFILLTFFATLAILLSINLKC